MYIWSISGASAGLVEVRNFDAVLVGSPVYMGGYPRAVRQFVRENHSELINVGSSGFFSTCLTATPGTRETYLESLGPVRRFLDEAAWTPEWIASFPGALNYREYNPLVQWIMKRISQKGGGPTATDKDYELTRWDEVERFAQDFDEGNVRSPFFGELVSLSTRTLNSLMPHFEERIVQEIAVPATPEEVRAAVEQMEPIDMPLAEILARIRNLGQRNAEEPTTFREAAMAFGMVPLKTDQAHEIAGGLIGQFWKRDFGIRRVRNLEEFREFADPAYTKAITNFWFDDFRDGKTLVRTETRVHSLGPVARRRFRFYWTVAGAGIRLYMASMLRGIRKCAIRRRLEHRTVAV